MKTLLLFTMFIGNFILRSTSENKSYEEMGRSWYYRRAEDAKGVQAQAGPISRAIVYFEKVLKNSSPKEEIVVYLMSSYYYKATYVPLSKNERKILYDKGKDLGQEMLDHYPHSAAIRFWLASHWGKWAEVYGVLQAARKGVAHRIKSLCEEIINLDEDYHEGGGYLILGLVHHYTPRIPLVLAWPSNKQSVVYLRKAVEISANPGNMYCLAVSCYEDGNRDEAIKLLEKVIEMDPQPQRLVEDRYVINKAVEFLRLITSK